MVEFLGINIPTQISLTGALSNSWVYVAIVSFIGFLLILLLILVLFYKTYNMKIELWENISGTMQRTLVTRARVIKLGNSGDTVLKTLKGTFLPAYGKKIAKNTFLFCMGQDGYPYNSTIGDFDAKRGELDIEPVDRDVRMFHVALDRLSHQTYGKTSFLEKYGNVMLGFIFMIVLILGMWFIVGKIGDATGSLSRTAESNERVANALSKILEGADNIADRVVENKGDKSGLVPAT